jgi:hypothetical protein
MGDTYYRAFGPSDPRRGTKAGVLFDDIVSPHGVSGTVVSVSGQTVTVEDRDNTEKIVHLTASTMIRKLRSAAAVADLKAGDQIIAVGEPGDSGEIEAKLVRIMPPPTSETAPVPSR